MVGSNTTSPKVVVSALLVHFASSNLTHLSAFCSNFLTFQDQPFERLIAYAESDSSCPQRPSAIGHQRIKKAATRREGSAPIYRFLESVLASVTFLQFKTAFIHSSLALIFALPRIFLQARPELIQRQGFQDSLATSAFSGTVITWKPQLKSRHRSITPLNW